MQKAAAIQRKIIEIQNMASQSRPQAPSGAFNLSIYINNNLGDPVTVKVGGLVKVGGPIIVKVGVAVLDMLDGPVTIRVGGPVIVNTCRRLVIFWYLGW